MNSVEVYFSCSPKKKLKLKGEAKKKRKIMKREYVEERHQQAHKFQHHYQLHHPEEEDDNHSPIHYSAKRNLQPPEDDPLPPPPPNDGATIELVRRHRGRPPGSKNKPKPPFIITKESSHPSTTPYILEIPAGIDIIEATTRFCKKRNTSLCILNGHGIVTNVTLKQPSTNVTFHGHFDILSISSTILVNGPSTGLAGNGLFTISLAVGSQGQVVGGVVVEPLVSAATIYLIATAINSPSFYRLQNDIDDDDHESPSGRIVEHCGINSLYSYGQPSDVTWAPPIARQPHQLPPYN